jgi:hypothetical protein
VKSRGSERREGTRVRSTALPFARQVEDGPRDARSVNASPGKLASMSSDKGVRFRFRAGLSCLVHEAWSSRGDR